MRLISGLKSASAQRIVEARAERPFDGAEDLSRRANLEQHEMKLLAAADALASLSGHRRQQVWYAAALHAPPELLRDAPVEDDILELPEAPEGEEIVFDYSALGLILRRHPIALLRDRLRAKRFLAQSELRDLPNGPLVRTCGIVTIVNSEQVTKTNRTPAFDCL
jgi:error-prone DNA polymerase